MQSSDFSFVKITGSDFNGSGALVDWVKKKDLVIRAGAARVLRCMKLIKTDKYIWDESWLWLKILVKNHSYYSEICSRM